jgi:hypothetical protein
VCRDWVNRADFHGWFWFWWMVARPARRKGQRGTLGPWGSGEGEGGHAASTYLPSRPGRTIAFFGLKNEERST